MQYECIIQASVRVDEEVPMIWLDSFQVEAEDVLDLKLRKDESDIYADI